MSFRELRIFTETMRLLGYEERISIESFRTPNIVLVAEIMHWMVKRYEPSADIEFEIEYEPDRVNFFRRICETVQAKARIKLNMKKLYMADGHAVQEMLKLATLLKQGTVLRNEDEADYSTLQASVQQRGHGEAKHIRQLCSDLTNQGSSLFFLLDSEMQTRQNRERILTRATEVSDFERRLRDLVSSVSQQVETLKTQLETSQVDSQNLEGKIENKKTQLDRNQKRLDSLLKVRPAFMEEYEKFEGELHQQFVVYLEQYRNLEYLEHVLAKFNKVEDELLAEQEQKLRVMREKLKREELKILRGESVPEDGDMGDLGHNQFPSASSGAANRGQPADDPRSMIGRPRAASGRQRPPTSEQAQRAGGAGPGTGGQGNFGGGGGGGGTAHGNMNYGGGDSDDTDDTDDDDDDSDDEGTLIDDDDDDLDDSDLTDDDDDDDLDDDDDDDDDE